MTNRKELRTRREFLSSTASLLPTALLLTHSDQLRKRTGDPRPLGAQLWTARDLAAKDLGAVLNRIATIGYKQVEFAGYYGKSPAEIRTMLHASGMTAPSAHIRFEDIRDGIAAALSAARIIGHKYLIFAWIPEGERTRDGYLRIADLLNRAGKVCAPYRIKVGYHNYSYDFAISNGRPMYDLILDNTDPVLVSMEMDVYWMLAGGGDPVKYLRRYKGRYHLIHIKDMLGDPPHTMVDVGDGIVDWPHILREAARDGARHFIIEHDEPADPMLTLERSYQYVRSLNF